MAVLELDVTAELFVIDDDEDCACVDEEDCEVIDDAMEDVAAPDDVDDTEELDDAPGIMTTDDVELVLVSVLEFTLELVLGLLELEGSEEYSVLEEDVVSPCNELDELVLTACDELELFCWLFESLPEPPPPQAINILDSKNIAPGFSPPNSAWVQLFALISNDLQSIRCFMCLDVNVSAKQKKCDLSQLGSKKHR